MAGQHFGLLMEKKLLCCCFLLFLEKKKKKLIRIGCLAPRPLCNSFWRWETKTLNLFVKDFNEIFGYDFKNCLCYNSIFAEDFMEP